MGFTPMNLRRPPTSREFVVAVVEVVVAAVVANDRRVHCNHHNAS